MQTSNHLRVDGKWYSPDEVERMSKTFIKKAWHLLDTKTNTDTGEITVSELAWALTRLRQKDDAKEILQAGLKYTKASQLAKQQKDFINQLPEPKCIFIHIPKTGGTSLINILPKNSGSISHSMLCDDFAFMQEIEYYRWIDDNCFTFEPTRKVIYVANIRNIYSFFVSYFQNIRTFGHTPSYVEDYIASEKGFEYFIEYLSEKTESWVSRDLVFFQPFVQPSGLLGANWVNRLEHIDEDWKAFNESYDLLEGRLQEGEHVPVLNKNKKSTTTDYRTFYSDRLAALVGDTWSDDFDLYGFDFEKPYREGSFLHRDTSKFRENWNYSPFREKKLITKDESIQ